MFQAAFRTAGTESGGGGMSSLPLQFDAGLWDPVTAVEAALDGAGGDRARHVFIALDADDIRRSAEASRNRLRRGEARPLDGVAIAWKDVFARIGDVSTAGSRIPALRTVGHRTAPIVHRMEELGAVFFGRTNLSEMALGGLGLNPHYGTPVNALSLDRDRAPGGSSSGSAVAVALGLVPAAFGTDTSGSIRVPAAFNGITGFRPSHGRYPEAGVFALAPDLDTVGILARGAGDVAFLDGLICREPALGGYPKPSGLVVPETIVLDGLDPIVADRFDRALSALSSQGVRITHRPLQSFDMLHSAMERHGTPVVAEAYRRHGGLLRGPDFDLMDPNVRRRLSAGAEISNRSLDELGLARRQARRCLQRELGQEALAFPTVPIVAPLLADLVDPDSVARLNALALRNTMLGSLLDMPSISLPIGTGPGGLAAGLQLSMTRGRDRALLEFARDAERALALMTP